MKKSIEKQLEDIVTKLWISGVAYGMALMMQNNGLYDGLDTSAVAKEIYPDAVILTKKMPESMQKMIDNKHRNM